MKKVLCAALVLIFVFSLSACYHMPFNGEIVFNYITLTIPETFVRDSTQSNDDLWIFERNMYEEYILISRNEIKNTARESLEEYVEAMNERGGKSELVSLSNNDAAVSVYYLEDEFSQEILFAHNDSLYAITLRNGTEDDFKELVASIGLLKRPEVE